MADLLDKFPEDLGNGREAQVLRSVGDHKVYNIVHLIHRARNYEGHRRITISRAPVCRSTGAGNYDTIAQRCGMGPGLSPPFGPAGHSRALSVEVALG
jgi:hypothetical protein